MSDGVIATNRLGNITVITKWLKIFGKDEDEAIGQPLVEVLGIKDRTSFDDCWKTLIQWY